jgi:RNA polymerase sigma factor (TIGR02999 family)
MSEVTRILSAIEQGDPRAAGQLLPLVYAELRALAAQRLAREKPGQTLQARPQGADWASRGHFFAAAAEAMRRILVDAARQKGAVKRGGGRGKVSLDAAASLAAPDAPPADDLIALDEALTRLAAEDPVKARLVELRYFAGLSIADAAAALGISPATAKRYWVYARSWLYGELTGE